MTNKTTTELHPWPAFEAMVQNLMDEGLENLAVEKRLTKVRMDIINAAIRRLKNAKEIE